jgi:single-strand DNA-binding protein
MNKLILIGNMTKKPELKYGNSDKPFCTFTLAVKRPFTHGENEKTDFLQCVVNRNAENIYKFCDKGSKVAVEGYLTVTKKNEQYFTNVQVNECEFLTPRNGNTSGSGQTSNSGQNEQSYEYVEVDDDSLPF